MKNKMYWCTNCLMPSTRPNITFNEDGVCHACQWAETKKTTDWDERKKELGKVCDKYRRNGREPDMIVPWSGGKDSIYVAYQMKEQFGMTPLLVTVIPHMETAVGKWNRENMCPAPTFQHLEMNLEYKKYRDLAKKYFLKWGKVKHPWEVAISAAIINYGAKNGLPFIMYGEEGGAEYGGTASQIGNDSWKKPVTMQYLTDNYYHGECDWAIPALDDIFFTQYSRWDNWSPSLHANLAIAKGMRTVPIRSIGTFTAHSQLSDKLQDLHQYIIYIKFGFGRASADASIAIRDGWSDRDEGLEWVETYDGEFPSQYFDEYCDYLMMTPQEFSETISSHANKDIMTGINHIWTLKPVLAMRRRKGTDLEFINPNRYRPFKEAGRC